MSTDSLAAWQVQIRENQHLAQAIANELNLAVAEHCQHLRCPCIRRCGVRRVAGWWRVVPLEQRLQWAEDVWGLKPDKATR